VPARLPAENAAALRGAAVGWALRPEEPWAEPCPPDVDPVPRDWLVCIGVEPLPARL
jgi:hypothetical protein